MPVTLEQIKQLLGEQQLQIMDLVQQIRDLQTQLEQAKKVVPFRPPETLTEA